MCDHFYFYYYFGSFLFCIKLIDPIDSFEMKMAFLLKRHFHKMRVKRPKIAPKQQIRNESVKPKRREQETVKEERVVIRSFEESPKICPELVRTTFQSLENYLRGFEEFYVEEFQKINKRLDMLQDKIDQIPKKS